MSKRLEVDLRDVARVVISGMSAYLLVHFLLLPRLIAWGVSFPTYFYIGVAVTGVLSVFLGIILRVSSERASGIARPIDRRMTPRVREQL